MSRSLEAPPPFLSLLLPVSGLFRAWLGLAWLGLVLMFGPGPSNSVEGPVPAFTSGLELPVFDELTYESGSEGTISFGVAVELLVVSGNKILVDFTVDVIGDEVSVIKFEVIFVFKVDAIAYKAVVVVVEVVLVDVVKVDVVEIDDVVVGVVEVEVVEVDAVEVDVVEVDVFKVNVEIDVVDIDLTEFNVVEVEDVDKLLVVVNVSDTNGPRSPVPGSLLRAGAQLEKARRNSSGGAGTPSFKTGSWRHRMT